LFKSTEILWNKAMVAAEGLGVTDDDLLEYRSIGFTGPGIEHACGEYDDQLG